MRVWDVETGEELHMISEVIYSDFSPDGNTIVTGGVGARLCLWDTGTWELLWRRTGYMKSAPRVAFAPDGARVVAGSSGGITLWDTEAGRLQQRLVGPSGASSA